MKLKFWETTPSSFDEPIAKILTELQTYSPNDPEYPALITHLAELNKLKEAEKASRRKFTTDTLLIVGGNLIGIGVIAYIERERPMNSKGMNYLKQIHP